MLTFDELQHRVDMDSEILRSHAPSSSQIVKIAEELIADELSREFGMEKTAILQFLKNVKYRGLGTAIKKDIKHTKTRFQNIMKETRNPLRTTGGQKQTVINKPANNVSKTVSEAPKSNVVSEANKTVKPGNTDFSSKSSRNAKNKGISEEQMATKQKQKTQTIKNQQQQIKQQQQQIAKGEKDAKGAAFKQKALTGAAVAGAIGIPVAYFGGTVHGGATTARAMQDEYMRQRQQAGMY